MLILNPVWPHFLGIFSLAFAFFLGIFNLFLNGWKDPLHCNALLNRGSWLDSEHSNWQPDGCMLYTYTEKEASSCLQSKEIIFIGDSVTRKLFFEFARSLDSSVAKIPLERAQKHSNHDLRTKYGTKLKFAWDPFLNTTYTRRILSLGEGKEATKNNLEPPPSMLVLGSGLWYLRYANVSGGISAWESNMEWIFQSLSKGSKPADEVIIVPVEQIVTSKLSQERADTMHPSDIEAMNSDLYHRINPPSDSFYRYIRNSSSPSTIPVSFPLVFNKMLDDTLTEDGLHFSDTVLRIQARILLNLRCNDVMPKTFPFNKTCCNRYPTPTLTHMLALALVLLLGLFLAFRVRNSDHSVLQTVIFCKSARAPLIISASLALIYLADRSDFWEKEQRQFNPWAFSSLCLISFILGLGTIVRKDKDLGFLNREQTDEWKGWMQAVVLVYHYYYASKISGIYNTIRVLVASYLFMTGYGHTTYYLRKADFSLIRMVQVLIRINLFTILLAYTMNTNYISYYFTPLVTMWYIVIYLTLLPASRFNNRTPFLLAKIFVSACFMTWIFRDRTLLEKLFEILYKFCGIHWSAREWAFRVSLDMWIVYVGMLVSIAVIKVHEMRLTENPRWPNVVTASTVVSVVGIVWFFMFELCQESKFTYNAWHPYISFLPIISFVILRNANPVLRSASSRAFVFLGKCSLELFIIQFHFWLAGDSKGVLVVLPATRWRPLNFVITTAMFVYLCDRVSWASGDLVIKIDGGEGRKGLPRPVISHPPPSAEAVTSTVFDADAEERGQESGMSMQHLGAPHTDAEKPEPDTPIRPRRWVDRLVDRSQSPALKTWLASYGTTLPLQAKIFLLMLTLWIFNIFWIYPADHTS